MCCDICHPASKVVWGTGWSGEGWAGVRERGKEAAVSWESPLSRARVEKREPQALACRHSLSGTCERCLCSCRAGEGCQCHPFSSLQSWHCSWGHAGCCAEPPAHPGCEEGDRSHSLFCFPGSAGSLFQHTHSLKQQILIQGVSQGSQVGHCAVCTFFQEFCGGDRDFTGWVALLAAQQPCPQPPQLS